MNMNNALKNNYYLKKVTVFFMMIYSLTAFGQQSVSSVFDLMKQEGILEINLRTDLGKLLASAENKAVYQAASISFSTEDNGFQVWHIKIKPRGKFRRQNCDFPPLKFDFSKEDLNNEGLAAYDKLKLVTHCLDNRTLGTENLLREYLAYSLYQEVSPYAYRVQLVKIQYIDEQGKVSGFKRYGFIMESTEELAARLKGEECEECTYSKPADFDQQAASVHAMFQYMIGNSDYSIPLLRNVKLIRRQLDQKLVPVGYDFDFSGIVNAPYARPALHMGQQSLSQRIYLGTMISDADLQYTIGLFYEKQEALYSIVNRFRKLNGLKRLEVVEYLESFYAQMDEIRETGYHDVYHQLRREHLSAIPDGGRAIDYGISKR
jgi:hypothetical protein